MKKLVYILVAVFTMISVNANADHYTYLHWSYPGCDVEHIDTIWVDDDSNIYKDETKTEEIEYRLPTCKGYKFTNFYYKDEDGNLITYSGNPIYIYKNGTIRPERVASWGSNDEHLYGNGWTRVDSEFKDEDGNECFLCWARPNYKGKEGFWIAIYDSCKDLISRTWYDWNYMKDIDVATTTSINEVEDTSHSTIKEGIYTLNGVKVENITKSGIYIINGKKVMVK